jgi:Leucine-rich repeat (LRR) protein
MKKTFYVMAMCATVACAAAACTGEEENDPTQTGEVIDIPDPAFRAFCLENFDNNGDGKIREGEVATVEKVRCPNRVIQSINGIEHFTMLKDLSFALNKISTVDVSKNKMLEILYCYGNPLATLDVSKNVELLELHCYEMQLDSIDLFQNVKLQKLSLGDNKLYNLDISHCVALQTLSVSGNPMSSLNVSKNKNLQMVGAQECPKLTLIYVWKGCNHSSWNVQGGVNYFEVGE